MSIKQAKSQLGKTSIRGASVYGDLNLSAESGLAPQPNISPSPLYRERAKAEAMAKAISGLEHILLK